MRLPGLLFLSALVALLPPGAHAILVGNDDGEGSTSFERFVAKHGRQYKKGTGEGHTSEWAMREALFHQRSKEVAQINARPGLTWVAGVGPLADWTEQELMKLRMGYTPGSQRPSAKSALVGEQPSEVQAKAAVPDSFDWSDKNLKAASDITDQKDCGSCWASAAINVLLAHEEIAFNTSIRRSLQELVSCTPNPHNCGGRGGCNGSTIGLALNQALVKGLAKETEWPYQARTLNCTQPKAASKSPTSNGLLPAVQDALVQGLTRTPLKGMINVIQLDMNKLEPLMQALVTHGPIGVHVATGMSGVSHGDDADSGKKIDSWMLYKSGVHSGCPIDVVVDHAVTLYGYGKEGSTKYWRVMNSWNKNWGEDGYMRFKRFDDKEEEAYCGWDTDPQKGVGCDGGPAKTRVCGSCGILHDTVHPIFTADANAAQATEPAKLKNM